MQFNYCGIVCLQGLDQGLLRKQSINDRGRESPLSRGAIYWAASEQSVLVLNRRTDVFEAGKTGKHEDLNVIDKRQTDEVN